MAIPFSLSCAERAPRNTKLNGDVKMKIVEISTNGNGKASGRKELGAAEKWVFDIQDGELRLKTLMNMSTDQQGIAELSEFIYYGSGAEKSYGLDISLNHVIILGNLPLLARGRSDRNIIKNLETFDLNIYNKALRYHE